MSLLELYWFRDCASAPHAGGVIRKLTSYACYRGIQDLTLAELVQYLEQQLASRYLPFADDRNWPTAEV